MPVLPERALSCRVRRPRVQPQPEVVIRSQPLQELARFPKVATSRLDAVVAVAPAAAPQQGSVGIAEESMQLGRVGPRGAAEIHPSGRSAPLPIAASPGAAGRPGIQVEVDVLGIRDSLERLPRPPLPSGPRVVDRLAD